MPQQELFFEQQIGDRRIEVVKSYDSGYAREVFDEMDEAEQEHLWKALELDAKYDLDDLPDVRLDPNLLSFFVVTEMRGTTMQNRYVSSDWPSAEEYAKNLISG